MLARDENSLPVEISQVALTIKDARSSKQVDVVWPVISLTAWATLALQQRSEMMLGGHHISNQANWGSMLRTFWARYKLIDNSHPVFTGKVDTSTVIP